MLVRGAPADAARKVSQAMQRVRRVHGYGVGSLAGAWYAVEARVKAARKVLSDAIDRAKTALDDAAKDLLKQGVAIVRDAIQGAKDAASAAATLTKQWWSDALDEAERVAKIVGAGVGAAAGGAALLWLLAAVLVLSSVSGRARPREYERYMRSKAA